MPYYMITYLKLSMIWTCYTDQGVSNHLCLDCFFNCLFRPRSKKKNLRTTGLCEGNSSVTGEFLVRRASNAGKVSIRWRRHVSSHHAPCNESNNCINVVLSALCLPFLLKKNDAQYVKTYGYFCKVYDITWNMTGLVSDAKPQCPFMLSSLNWLTFLCRYHYCKLDDMIGMTHKE